MFRRKNSDLQLLKTLAEHRLLSVPQVTVLHFKSKQIAWRRLRQLSEQGWVETLARGLGRSRGRPENLFFLSEAGADSLRDEGILRHSIDYSLVRGDNLGCVDHQLLVNWFRIHLGQVGKALPRLEVNFISSNSPFSLGDNSDTPLVYNRIPAAQPDGKPQGFTPDGVFSIHDKEKDKTLLFFLEVDMGTESLASPKRSSGDLRQKVIRYQTYSRHEIYKRYEQIWHCTFKGFRLLFLAHTPSRMEPIGRLVQEMPPSSFIWVSDQDRMFSEGFAGAIWARGGTVDRPLESILGQQLCRRSPVLPIGS